jgi:hypothetical protein
MTNYNDGQLVRESSRPEVWKIRVEGSAGSPTGPLSTPTAAGEPSR